MAARSGKVRVSITLDDKGLTQGTHKADKALSKFEKSGTKRLKGVAKSVAGVGAAFASFGAAKAAISTTTTLAKTTLALHRNLGLTVAESSRWAAVAHSRDIDSKALNQSFVTLSKNIGAAGIQQDKYRAKLAALGSSEKDQEKRQGIIAKGAGLTVSAFNKLGISQKELASSDFSSVLRQAADGLKALPPGADRAALSAKLFGRGWCAAALRRCASSFRSRTSTASLSRERRSRASRTSSAHSARRRSPRSASKSLSGRSSRRR